MSEVIGKSRQGALRNEAALVSWKDLTEEQKQAGRQAHRLLIEMAMSPEKVDKPQLAFLPRLDRSRHSRVLLIDGGRGSGKTELLLTMLEHWRQPFFEERQECRAGDPLNPKPDHVDGIDDYRRRIVPIGLLDLHPLALSTNLLMHVVGRFWQVVESLEDRDREAESPAWHLASEQTGKSRKKWKALVHAVAAAWDGNAYQRRARMDLEAYTVELEEAERQRLDLVSAFTEFVETLVEEFGKWQGSASKGPPLFLLAVDDADMNPSRSVELLIMLRMLWHPRVAFLLTGDSELFEQTLTEHFLGEIRKPLRGQVMLDREIGIIANKRRPAALASEVYEKVIPPGHRCVMAPIPPAQRLLSAPLGLAAVFTTIHAEEKHGPTLFSYFQNSPQLYECLPDRVRDLIDLADIGRLAAETSAANAAAAASHVVEKIWRYSVRRAATQISGYDDDAVHTRQVPGALRISLGSAGPGIWASKLHMAVRSDAKESGPQVVLSAVDRLEAVTETGDYLPRELTAALMLAADVAADQTYGSWNMSKTQQGGYEGIFAKSFYQASSTTSLRFAWPLPDGFSLPFYAAFSSRWTQKLRVMKDSKEEPWVATAEDLDELARHFLYLVSYLWSGSHELSVETKTPSWGAIARLVTTLNAQGALAWKRWAAARAGLLAAPEYGLPAKSANQWLEELKNDAGQARWKGFVEALHAERKERATMSGAAEPAQALAEIDKTFAEHCWAIKIEGRPEPPAAVTPAQTASGVVPKRPKRSPPQK